MDVDDSDGTPIKKAAPVKVVQAKGKEKTASEMYQKVSQRERKTT